VNPNGLTTFETPILGSVWNSTVDLAGADIAVLLIGLGGPTSGVVLNSGAISGELLVLPPFVRPPITSPTGNLGLPLPGSPSLLGARLFAQGATLTGGLPLELQNAIDLTLGTF